MLTLITYTGNAGVKRRVKDLTQLGLFRQFVSFLTGLKTTKVGGEYCCARGVDEIRIGHTGYGEPNKGNCMSMSGQWLESFVDNKCPMEWFTGWEIIGK